MGVTARSMSGCHGSEEARCEAISLSLYPLFEKNCSCYEKGSYCSGDTRDSGLIPHKTSPHSLLSYDTTLRPWARFPFDSPQAPNCFAARCLQRQVRPLAE